MLPAPLTTVTTAFVASLGLLAATPATAGDDGAAKKVVPAVPLMQKVAPGDAKPAASVPTTIDPKAQAIQDHAIDALKKLKGIDMVTDMKVNGIDPAMLPPGVGGKTHVKLDFTNPIEGPAPFGRFTLESMKDGKPVARFAFDGKTAILVDEPTKSFEATDAQWFQLLGQRAAALPQWHIENRMDLAALGASKDDLPKLVGLAIVGEETVDGTPCDVLKAVRTVKLEGMEDDEGKPMSGKEMRIVETVAFARADGLPRRVASVTEIPGEEAMAGMDTVTTFTAVKVDPAFDAASFSTKAPDGYAKQDGPKADDAGAPPEPELKVKAGDAAPAFTLKDLDGKDVSLASLAGKVVLLDFWATWCNPCKAAMPFIQKIHDEYKGKGVMVYGVNTGDTKDGAAKKYMAEKGYTYPCLLAGDDLANKSYGTSAIPTLVVIGKDGKIAMVEVGFGGDQKIRAAIDAALAK